MKYPDPEMGTIFGRFTVVGTPARENGRRYIPVVCECGTTKTVLIFRLLSGNTKSCGCLQPDAAARCASKHGLHVSDTYGVWKGMRNRCNNPRGMDYKNYGGRGITVDPAWDDFATFVADMGPRPEGMFLERDDNDLGYSKGNCRWATRAEQNSNKRNNVWVEYCGVRATSSVWSRVCGVSTAEMCRRLQTKSTAHALKEIAGLDSETIKELVNEHTI